MEYPRKLRIVSNGTQFRIESEYEFNGQGPVSYELEKTYNFFGVLDAKLVGKAESKRVGHWKTLWRELEGEDLHFMDDWNWRSAQFEQCTTYGTHQWRRIELTSYEACVNFIKEKFGQAGLNALEEGREWLVVQK